MPIQTDGNAAARRELAAVTTFRALLFPARTRVKRIIKYSTEHVDAVHQPTKRANVVCEILPVTRCCKHTWAPHGLSQWGSRETRHIMIVEIVRIMSCEATEVGEQILLPACDHTFSGDCGTHESNRASHLMRSDTLLRILTAGDV